MKNLMIVLALIIGGTVVAQNPNAAKNNNKVEKVNKEVKAVGIEKINKSEVLTGKENVQIKGDKEAVEVGGKIDESKEKVPVSKEPSPLQGLGKGKGKDVIINNKEDGKEPVFQEDEMNDVDELPSEVKIPVNKEKEPKENNGKGKEASLEKGNNGNAYGTNKEGLSNEEFAALRSAKNKGRKDKKEKKPKKEKKSK